MSSKTVFVTTGATVIFQELITLSLQKKFLDLLIKHGVQKLTLQFGVPKEGKQTFINQLENLLLKVESKEESLYSNYKSLLIEGFSFTNDINSIILKSDIVISHAGTGSILDVLRLQKPLIVVINSALMNNHQDEIANELLKENFLLKSSSKLDDLIKNFEEINVIKLTPFPKPNISILTKVLNEL